MIRMTVIHLTEEVLNALLLILPVTFGQMPHQALINLILQGINPFITGINQTKAGRFIIFLLTIWELCGSALTQGLIAWIKIQEILFITPIRIMTLLLSVVIRCVVFMRI